MKRVGEFAAIALMLFAFVAFFANNAQPISNNANAPYQQDITFPNLLTNGGFEAGYDGSSHLALVIPVDDGGTPDPSGAYYREAPEIVAPRGWTAWYLHGGPVQHDPGNPVGWSAPEVRPVWVGVDPIRVHSGDWGAVAFTFYRIHDAGLFQQVQVEPGTRLRLSAYAHAWSNHDGGPHPDDPRWSEGAHVGYAHACLSEGTAGLDSGDRNFTFRIGIDPTGGVNPYAETVVWGPVMHAYNAYCRIPAIEVAAEAETATVFIRSRTLWPFKHNDAYWDDISLIAVRGRVYLPLVMSNAGR